MNLTTAFLIVALVLFVLAAIPYPPLQRFNLIAAGLAFYVLSHLTGRGV